MKLKKDERADQFSTIEVGNTALTFKLVDALGNPIIGKQLGVYAKPFGSQLYGYITVMLVRHQRTWYDMDRILVRYRIYDKDDPDYRMTTTSTWTYVNLNAKQHIITCNRLVLESSL